MKATLTWIFFGAFILGGLWLCFRTAAAAFRGEKLTPHICAIFGFWATFYAYVRMVTAV